MDRPQWKFRHGAPCYKYRYRHLPTFGIELRYNTLDVVAEDEDNFFKVAGNLVIDGSSGYLSPAERWRVMRDRARITHHAAHVREYLLLKENKRRLRVAGADLAWHFEPYRRELERRRAHLETLKERFRYAGGALRQRLERAYIEASKSGGRLCVTSP